MSSDKSTGQIVGGIVGAVIGGYFFGNALAAYSPELGLGVFLDT